MTSTFSGSSSTVTSRGKLEVGDTQRVPDLGLADVEREPVRHLERQRLDRHLAHELGQHAADLDAGRLAHELDGNLRADRLVEPHLVQVDVREVAANRILLVVLDHRSVRRLLVVEHDVEDRVQAVRPAERARSMRSGTTNGCGFLPRP